MANLKESFDRQSKNKKIMLGALSAVCAATLATSTAYAMTKPDDNTTQKNTITQNQAQTDNAQQANPTEQDKSNVIAQQQDTITQKHNIEKELQQTKKELATLTQQSKLKDSQLAKQKQEQNKYTKIIKEKDKEAKALKNQIALNKKTITALQKDKTSLNKSYYALKGKYDTKSAELEKATKVNALSTKESTSTTMLRRGSNEELARSMAADRGWTGNQWVCLRKIWKQESKFNHLAKNPSSGAYGIPQSLPGSKMASAGRDWKTNPATQITWGLEYISDRYGTPCGAYNFKFTQGHGWY